ncbi:unnamed protein product [Amoebophrya sp. A120]|nr:unnamed protein product [Amoebophrya sp. A120]|eukprot:GSA120T00007430001.1
MRLYLPPPRRTTLAAATAPPGRSFFINLLPVILQKMILLCEILVLSSHCGFFSHLRSCSATASTTAASGKQERARPNYYDPEEEVFSVARHQEVGELLQRSHDYHPLEDRRHAGERTATARPTGSASGPPRTLFASLLQEEQRQLQRRREAQTQRLAADASSLLTAHRFMYAPSSPLWTSIDRDKWFPPDACPVFFTDNFATHFCEEHKCELPCFYDTEAQSCTPEEVCKNVGGGRGSGGTSASSSKNQCQRKPCAQISFPSSAENDEELLRRYRICINAGGGGGSAGMINNPVSTAVACQYDVKGNMCVITSNSFGSFFNKKKKATTSASSFVSVGTTTTKRTSKTKITQRRTKRQKIRTSTRQLLWKTKSAGGATTTSNVKQAAEEDIQLAESDLDSMDLSALKSTGVKAFKPFSESTLNMKQQLLDEVHKTTQAHDAAQKAFAEAEKVFFSTTWKLKSLFRSSAEKLAMLKQQFPSLHRGVWAFLAEQKGLTADEMFAENIAKTFHSTGWAMEDLKLAYDKPEVEEKKGKQEEK